MANGIVLLIARVFLSVMFIMSGISKLGGISGTAGYIESVGLPAPTVLAWLSAIFEIVTGAAILIGFQTRFAAYLLAIFCVFTGLMFHYAPEDQIQMTMLMKNLAIAGGFLALAVTGAGGISVDARRA